ncbi:MAG: hypothetical protein PHT33_13320, partial [bacterium]|nr:hypothetical protein [bacterium]
MLIRLLLTALIILLPVSPALAVSPDVVYVDDDYTSENCDAHVWGTDAFASMQAGVDAAAEGGTVHVYAGAYIESVTCADSKSIKLEGDLNISGNLTLSSGVVMALQGHGLTVSGSFSNAGTIRLYGSENVSLTGGNDTDSGVWEYIGDGNGTVNIYYLKRFGSGTGWNYYNLIINDPSLPEESRDIFCPESTGGNSELWVNGQLEIKSGWLTATEKIEVQGELLVGGGTLDAFVGAIAAHGDVTVSAGSLLAPGPVGITARFSIGGSYARTGGEFRHNDGRIVFNQTGLNKTVDQGDGDYPFKDAAFNGEGSAWEIAGHDMNLQGDLHVTDGTLATDTFKLKVDGTLTVDGGALDASGGSIDAAAVLIAGGAAELKAPSPDSDPAQPRFTVAGNFTNTVGTFTHNNGTLTFDNTADASITSGGTEDIKALYSLAHTGTGKLTLAAGNALRLDGDFTNSGGEFDAGGQAIRLSGSWVNSNLFTHGGGTVTLCGDMADKTVTPGDTSPFYNLTVDSVAGTGGWALSSAAPLQVIDTLTVNKGRFDAGSGNITARNVGIGAGGTLAAPGSSGSFNISGDFSDAGTYVHNSGTVVFSALEGQSQALDAGSASDTRALNNLTHAGAGTLLLNGDLQLAGNMTNSDGLLDQNGRSMVVAGNWSNIGTFTHNGGKVTFADNAKTSIISGETVFFNLSCNTSGKLLKFGEGETQTVQGKFDINGGISDENAINPVRLRSSDFGSTYTIDNSGDVSVGSSVFYADVQDCTAVNTVYASFSRDAGKNSNWRFSMAGSLVAVVNGTSEIFDPGVPDEHSYPDISPSNTYPYIVYGLGRYVMLAGRDGSDPRIIADLGQGKSALTCRFSPDGSKIAVWVAESTLRQIWVIGIDTAGTRTSSDVVWSHMAERARSNLAWSHDGSCIYFFNYYAGSLQQVSAAGGDPVTVNDFKSDAFSGLIVVDFDIFPTSGSSRDRPLLVVKKADGSYSLRIYNDTTSAGFEGSYLEYPSSFPWSGFDPEGPRPVCIRENA